MRKMCVCSCNWWLWPHTKPMSRDPKPYTHEKHNFVQNCLENWGRDSYHPEPNPGCLEYGQHGCRKWGPQEQAPDCENRICTALFWELGTQTFLPPWWSMSAPCCPVVLSPMIPQKQNPHNNSWLKTSNYRRILTSSKEIDRIGRRRRGNFFSQFYLLLRARAGFWFKGCTYHEFDAWVIRAPKYFVVLDHKIAVNHVAVILHLLVHALHFVDGHRQSVCSPEAHAQGCCYDAQQQCPYSHRRFFPAAIIIAVAPATPGGSLDRSSQSSARGQFRICERHQFRVWRSCRSSSSSNFKRALSGYVTGYKPGTKFPRSMWDRIADFTRVKL